MKNETLINLAKVALKNLLSECTDEQKLMFKRMYCSKNLELSVDDAVDQMDNDKIDWAMTQVERTIKFNKTRDL